jgi:hypothetical protein
MLGPVSILSGSAQQPDLLGSDGQIRLLPSSAYDSFDRQGLRLWCHIHVASNSIRERLMRSSI